MAFPADKETWVRKQGKDLVHGILGDVIEASDFNDYATFLENLQDTLGITIIGGYGSVKARLDATATLDSTFVLTQLTRGQL